ncbi:MAG TPA: hypothetical protein ENF83_04680 [Candidatus Korarchaeota archaeon]|nr:hypothetical protein [Candidatus Korarchaeota archaeon]
MRRRVPGAYRYVMLVGLPGCGKSAVASILRDEIGYEVIDMSDLVKEEARRRGRGVDRESLRRTGEELRREMGRSAVAKLVLRRIRELEGEAPRPGYVISGIRNQEEVDEIKAAFGDEAVCVAIHTPKRLRYLRMLRRGRRGFDAPTMEEMERQDRREVEFFRMGEPFILADELIVNSGSLEELRSRALAVVLRIPGG